MSRVNVARIIEGLDLIGALSRNLRQGGCDSGDLQGLEEGLSTAVDLANELRSELELEPAPDPADPWRGLYAPELMPKLDGVKVWHAAHPDLPEWPDEEERSIGPLIVAQGFAFAVVSGEYPDDDYAADEPDACAWLASWRPEPPAGEQWRLVMIQDTEDGPAAVFVRPLALIDASHKGDALQDDRFPGGFADAIAYADEMEEGAGRLYEQVIGFEDGSHTGTDMLAAVLRELQASPKGAVNPDDLAVDAFAAAMKAKLAEARAKGRGGWNGDEPDMQERLSGMLRDHVEKGDPRDVANFCMFLHQRGEGISPRGGGDVASIPEPHQECYSDDGGDSWHEHPADAELVEGLAVGETYTLTVSHYSVERTYRVTKAPDETSDGYEVEPVQATSAEVGECNCPNGRAEHMEGCAALRGKDAPNV